MRKILVLLALVLGAIPCIAQQYPPYIFLDANLNPYPSGSGAALGSNPPYALCYTNVTGQPLPCNFSGGGGGGVSGSGTTGFVPLWTGSTALGNSLADYGVTTASTFTFAAPINFVGGTLTGDVFFSDSYFLLMGTTDPNNSLGGQIQVYAGSGESGFLSQLISDPTQYAAFYAASDNSGTYGTGMGALQMAGANVAHVPERKAVQIIANDLSGDLQFYTAVPGATQQYLNTERIDGATGDFQIRNAFDGDGTCLTGVGFEDCYGVPVTTFHKAGGALMTAPIDGNISTVDSATTIAPTTPFVEISGTTSIATITPFGDMSSTVGGCIDILMTGTAATTTAGNIAAIYTLTSGTMYRACWFGTKWYIK